MNKTTLQQVLTYPGLEEKEAEVYLASLKIRRPTPQTISREIGIPRPSVYRILEALAGKGLMGKVMEDKKTVYVPEDPQAIVARLKLQTATIQSVMGDLKELATIYNNRPTMRFFEGEEGMKRVCDDVLSTNEKELLSFSSIEKWFGTLPDYFSTFSKKRIKKGMAVRILSPKSAKGIERKKIESGELRNIRFISDDLVDKIGIINGHIFIYADRIAFISFDSDKNSIIIENQALSNVQRSLFEIAWESVGSLKNKI